MSRRPLQPPIGRLAKAQSRMAPGGLLWSESPIPRRYSPRVREAGAVPEEPPPPETTVVLRPVLLQGYTRWQASEGGVVSTLNLVGGGGNATLGDDSDSTYARMQYTPLIPSSGASYEGTVLATFNAPTIGFEPTEAELTIRVRSLSNPVDNLLVYTLGHGFPNGGNPVESYIWNPPHICPDATWQTFIVIGPLDFDHLPSAADVAIGLQIVLDAGAWGYLWDDQPAWQLDVSDVSLTLRRT